MAVPTMEEVLLLTDIAMPIPKLRSMFAMPPLERLAYQ
jgi:hypothetical protein